MDPKVTAYLTKQQSPQKEIGKKLRTIFFKHFPQINEKMKFGVPYYDDKFYIVALKDHLNFGFEIKNFSTGEIKTFAGNGKTVKILEIANIKDIDETQIVNILKKVLK